MATWWYKVELETSKFEHDESNATSLDLASCAAEETCLMPAENFQCQDDDMTSWILMA